MLATLLLAPRTALGSPAVADPWWGRDKALHFGVSAGLALGGYVGSSLALRLDRPWGRAMGGASVALTAGIAKELWDAAGHGSPSWKDLAWDALGTAAGIGLALTIDVAFFDEPEPEARVRGSLRGNGATLTVTF